MSCSTPEEYAERLRQTVLAAAEEPGLTAILCRNEKSIRRVRNALGTELAGIPVIHRNQTLPGSGVCMITLGLVKGLEFDGVIIPDADTGGYPKDLLSAHRLYTAVSRATRRLTVMACGRLTKLLD